MLSKSIVLQVIEAALSRYLALDYHYKANLKPMIGKVIALDIKPFNIMLYLCPAPESIQIIDHYAGQPDTVIRGTLPSLTMMGVSNSPMRSIFSGEVEIEGDMRTGRKFQALFENLDIDYEHHLARYTGGFAANQVGHISKRSSEWIEETIETFHLNVTELLQEETRDLPAPAETNRFFSDVDLLRMDVDRLAVRLQKITRSLPPSEPSRKTVQNDTVIDTL
ncbi:MAG: SCP2 sterol-binding domain-containing protein [Methylococcaceae bacterium]